METELQAIFARHLLRLTNPRRRIFATMKIADEPMSAAAIARMCSDIDRTSVYRTLELFTSLGIAQVVPVGWKRRYELAGPFKSHHHHLSCRHCGALIDIHSAKLENVMSDIAEDYGFTAEAHTFEIRGTCQKCR